MSRERRDSLLPIVHQIEVVLLLLFIFASVATSSSGTWDSELRFGYGVSIISLLLILSATVDYFKNPWLWLYRSGDLEVDKRSLAIDRWLQVIVIHTLLIAGMAAGFATAQKHTPLLMIWCAVLLPAIYKQYEQVVGVEFLTWHLPILGTRRKSKDTPHAP